MSLLLHVALSDWVDVTLLLYGECVYMYMTACAMELLLLINVHVYLHGR